MEQRTFLRRTWIEWAVVACVLLIFARVYWATELRAAEDRLLQSLGIEPALKFLVVVPVGLYLYWRFFKREHAAARQAGRPAIRKGVIVVCGLLLALAVALLLMR